MHEVRYLLIIIYSLYVIGLVAGNLFTSSETCCSVPSQCCDNMRALTTSSFVALSAERMATILHIATC